MKSLAIALGSGGARGLANIAVLEAVDEMGITPVALAGASAGALIGAAYASGITGRELHRHVIALAHDRAEVLRRLVAARVPGLPNIWAAPFGNPILIDAEKFVAAFLPETAPATFEELKVPLTVIASDLYGRREVVFRSGPLRPALAASMAVPGLVQPLIIDGRVLVDGGAVDPLPFSQLMGRADVVAAVDCSAARDGGGQIPDAWESIFATLTLMGQTIVAEKLKHGTPDLILRPNVGQFRLLDFFLASSILRTAEPVKVRVKEKLRALLSYSSELGAE